MPRSKNKIVPEIQAIPVEQAAPKSSKQAQVIALLRDGVTLDDIQQITGWQKHSVRGFISGTVKKKLGLLVSTSKTEAGTVYRVEA